MAANEHPDALRVLARLLMDYRDNARAVEHRINEHARRTGAPFDRRADEARGAAGAYGMAIAALVGATGVRSIEDLAAEPLHHDMMRPVLPGELLGEGNDARTEGHDPDCQCGLCK